MTGRHRRLLMIEQGGRGGVADYTAALVAAIAAEGWEVTLATAADHLYGSIPGVRVEPVFHYTRGHSRIGAALRERGLGQVANGLRFLAALPRLARLARRADIAHTQGWEAPQIGVPALAALRLAGVPVIQTSHGLFDRGSYARGLRDRARRLGGRMTARMIVHTQADLSRVAELFGDAVVIPHGEYGGLASRGGAAERAPSRAALGLSRDAPTTLMFGQLRADKGLGDLLDAVAQVPELHLLIGGEDAGGLAAVRERIDRLGDRVILREGFLEMSEAAQLFAAADTVALPYLQSSASGVLLLAYGFARPVVVYPSGGMVEAVVDGETGWICSEPSAEALAATLAETVRAGSQECARRGAEGKRLSEQRYSWPAIARRTIELYEEVLA